MHGKHVLMEPDMTMPGWQEGIAEYVNHSPVLLQPGVVKHKII